MSEYHSQTTNFKDEDALVQSLVACGYKREDIEVHKDAVQLIDFQGRPTKYLDKSGDKANVIIRRHNIGYGSANDLGFKKNADGTYDAIVSQYDSGQGHWGAESSRMKALKTAYSETVLIKTAKKQGFKYLGKKIVNGKPQLQWLDTRA